MTDKEKFEKLLDKKIASALRDYERKYRGPGHGKLEVSKPYDLKTDWPDRWYLAAEQGVYLIFDENKHLLYVGKASMESNLGARLSSYFQYDPNNRNKCITNPRHDWGADKPRYVQAIAVEEPFEAPALEEYIISQLKPPANTRGV
ncbi:MAG: GIY-YIG nuclease family protein [Alphaproteobacteria bacterium]|nr:GIY-YIG nuclease family protein [Alphaproteobacteria bacterium]